MSTTDYYRCSIVDFLKQNVDIEQLEDIVPCSLNFSFKMYTTSFFTCCSEPDNALVIDTYYYFFGNPEGLSLYWICRLERVEVDWKGNKRDNECYFVVTKEQKEQLQNILGERYNKDIFYRA